MSRESARYTYTNGSRPEGVATYDNDSSCTSHHDTDPARGTHGAFDFVRLHKYGHLDGEVDKEKPMAERPSYRAMCEFAETLPQIRAARAAEEFVDQGPAHEPANDDWLDTARGSRNRVQSADEFAGALKPREWRIKNVQPLAAEFCVMFGDSGSGKSFLIDDMGAAVQLGRPWNGHPVKQGRVIKLVAEGAGDHRYRLHAQAQALDVSVRDLPRVIDNAPDLFDPKQAADVAREIEATGGCDALIIDTLSATFSQDENGSDMGAYVRNVKLIQRHLGCTIWVVHHSGKDQARGARGWSGLRAAADVELEVIRDDEARCVKVSKQKGGTDGGQFGFKLVFVPLGRDADGDQFGSCRVEYTENLIAATAKERASGRKQVLCLDLLKTMAPTGTVALEEFLDAFKAKVPRGDAKQDDRRKRGRRALEELIAKGLAHLHGEDHVSLTPLVNDNAEPF